MAAKRKIPPPPRFGQAEKPHRVRIALFWVIVLVAIAAIAWMIIANPRQKALVCRPSSGVASFNSFGNCVEQ